MALKNKDGSQFVLSKPNPIMTTQETWSKNELILHNKMGKIIVFPDPTRPIKKVVVKEEIPEEPKKEPEKPPEPVIVQKLEEPQATTTNSDKIQIWCLPASYKEYKDNLYNEYYRKINYGNKFLFEGIILKQEDFFIEIWTNTKAVTKDSVLFPRNQDKLWWRVDKIKKENEGYMICATISDYQPKFSD